MTRRDEKLLAFATDAALEDWAGRPWVLPGVLLLAAALRVAHLLWFRASPFFTTLTLDARYYDQWAQRIAGGEWVGRESFWVDPLYAYVLGVIYAVGGHDVLLPRLLNLVCGVLTVWLVARIARRVWGSQLAAVAAALALALGWDREPGDRLVATAGQRWQRCGIFLATAVPLILLATLHNYAASGEFVPTTTNLGINLYLGNHAGNQAGVVAWYQPGWMAQRRIGSLAIGWHNMGAGLADQGRREGARDAFARAAAIAPAAVPASLRMLATYYREDGDYPGAEETLRQLIAVLIAVGRPGS